MDKIIDLTKIKWNVANSKTTNGMLPKATIVVNGRLKYLKMSAYNSAVGVYGNDAIMEVIASRIGLQLGVSCLKYNLIRAYVVLNGNKFITDVCISDDFRCGCETIDLESLYLQQRRKNEYVIDFCNRIGVMNKIVEMFVFDYIICNLDRHGKNIELYTDNYILTHLFDNGFSLLSKINDESIRKASFNDGTVVNNYVGYNNLLKNLSFVRNGVRFKRPVRSVLFEGMANKLIRDRRDKIFELISSRYDYARKIGAIL